MAYIYQIINDVNGKIYIGKTERTIQERWGEHCRDYLKHDYEKRPLYLAMKKYGLEHFHIELIEETSQPEERECFWIEQKGSFKNGYNATLGGDGKRYIDYDLVIAAYQELQNITLTAKRLNISTDSVRNALNSKQINIKPSSEIAKEKYGKTIKMYNLKNEYLCSFSTLKEAASFLVNNGYAASTAILKGVAAHIRDCANNKRKTAYQHVWKW